MRRTFLEWCALVALLLALALFLSFGRANSVSGSLYRLDSALYDFANKIAPLPASDDLVVVEIDEASLAQIGRWPWDRSVHAKLISKLSEAGARVIGLDVLMADKSSADALVAAAIKKGAPVVLPVTAETDREGKRWPVYPAFLLGEAAHLGHARFSFDTDGVVRGLHLEEAGLPAYALSLLQIAGSDAIESGAIADALKQVNKQRRDESFGTATWPESNFVLLPGTQAPQQTRSYAEVLGTPDLGDSFKNKTVLVGATAAGMHDWYANAVISGTAIAPGIRLHAATLSALSHNKVLRRAPFGWHAVLIALLILATMVLLYRTSPRQGLLVVAIALVATASLSALILKTGYWLPPAGTLTAIVLAYPLWSWRRLESVVGGLVEQARILRQTPDVLKLATAGTANLHFEPQWERRRLAGLLLPLEPVALELRELRQAGQRIASLRLLLATVLESLPLAAFVCDENGRILIHNEVARTSFPDITQDMPALQWLASQFGDDPQVRALLLADKHETKELERRDKLKRHWLIDSIRVQDPELPPLSLVQFVDITEIRDLQMRREEMMRFISHDLRSPQISILSAIDQIPQAERGEWTTTIENHASNSLQLAQSFVQWTRAESKPFDEEPLDLTAIVTEAVDASWTLSGSGGKPRVPVKLLAPDTAPAIGDPQLLRRAVGNLIENAIKYGGQSNTVTVSVRTDGAQWVIAVADTGPGLQGVDSDTVFDAYVRGRGQTDRAGTGLGLAFVRMVAQRHGGTATAKDLPEGGACFEIFLPKDA